MSEKLIFKYYVVYKPYNCLSQFTSEIGEKTLKDFFVLPNDVYPVGRLDKDSEGLLIITNDKYLTDELLNPKKKHLRTYLAQVEDAIDERALKLLESSPIINVNGKQYKTLPAKAEFFLNSDTIPERSTPIRFRKNIPSPWILLSLTEGKNRQVRKMTAKVGFPTLRLIRFSIENLKLDSFEPANIQEYKKEEIYNLLNIKIKNIK